MYSSTCFPSNKNPCVCHERSASLLQPLYKTSLCVRSPYLDILGIVILVRCTYSFPKVSKVYNVDFNLEYVERTIQNTLCPIVEDITE